MSGAESTGPLPLVAMLVFVAELADPVPVRHPLFSGHPLVFGDTAPVLVPHPPYPFVAVLVAAAVGGRHPQPASLGEGVDSGGKEQERPTLALALADEPAHLAEGVVPGGVLVPVGDDDDQLVGRAR